MESTALASPRRWAQATGAMYVLVIFAGVLALVLRSSQFVRNDAAATAANILASESLYRLGIAADLLAGVAYLVVAALLYELLRPVSRGISFLAAFLGLGGSVVSVGTLLGSLASLAFLGSASYLAVFNPDERQALALLFIRLPSSQLSFVFFGFYCLTLGYLVWRSAFLPRLLGAGLAIAGLGWLTNSLGSLLWPPLGSAVASYALAAGGLGEGAFTLWLLVRGVDERRWRAQAGAAGERPEVSASQARGFAEAAKP